MAINYLKDTGVDPIVQDHAPSGQDYAPYGTPWVDQTLNDIYMAANTVNGLMVWVPCGGGSGIFSSLSVSGTSVLGGNVSITTPSTFTVGAFGKGVLVSNASGLISSSAGLNGQLLISKAGDAPIWANIIPGAGINITNGGNSIQIDATGATAVKYTTDDANIVLPDGTGNINVIGGSNLVSTGAIANTITIDLESTIGVTGKITAGNDFEMTLGTCLINSDDNSAQAIYLHANGGVNETIDIYSQLGTTATSLNLHSAVGGITIAAGTALALSAASASTFALTNAQLDIYTGTGALNIGADMTVHTVTIGSAVGASRLLLQAGTGDLAMTSTDAITITSTGIFDVNSTGALDLQTASGFVNIATDPVAAAVSIGNSTGASSVVVDCGTGNLDLGVTPTPHITRLGSVDTTSATTVQTGSGAMTFTAGGVFDVNAVGNVTIDSTSGTLNLGAGADAQNINIGTGAAARLVTIGNNTTTTGIQITSGTDDITLTSSDAIILDAAGVLELNSSAGVIGIGNDAVAQNINIGTGAASRVVTIGNNNTTTGLQLISGTGDIALNSADAVSVTAVGAVDIDTAGVVSINSTAGVLNIGNDADAFGINVGTGAAARTIEIGNNTGATAINLSAGSGEVNSDTDINLTTAGTGFTLQEGPKILAGAGSPNGSVVAPKGSLYLATNGSGAGDRAYINTNGNTAWTAIVTAA